MLAIGDFGWPDAAPPRVFSFRFERAGLGFSWSSGSLSQLIHQSEGWKTQVESPGRRQRLLAQRSEVGGRRAQHWATASVIVITGLIWLGAPVAPASAAARASGSASTTHYSV